MTETALERPKLRGVEPIRVVVDGVDCLLLKDPLALREGGLCVPFQVVPLLALMDGTNSILDIQADFSRRIGRLAPSDLVRALVHALDDAFLLEGERFQAAYRDKVARFRSQACRPAAHAGISYSADAVALREEIDGFFTGNGGPGAPEFFVSDARPVGLIAPHIDLRAGGATLAHGYHALMKGVPADTYIVLGTGHAGVEGLFAISGLDFDTPLGRVETDRDFLARMNDALGRDCAQEELIHAAEHSVEFQVVFLQRLLGERRPFKIVPILCSWSHHVFSETDGRRRRIFQEFTNALRELAREGNVCFISSADLDHIGPRYGDPYRPGAAHVRDALEKDRALLGHLERVDLDAFVRDTARDDDARRICGFSPITAMLASMEASSGRLLKLDHAVVDNQDSFVTFASMIFY
jgi:AmmeMemoRadiSam system protein B